MKVTTKVALYDFFHILTSHTAVAAVNTGTWQSKLTDSAAELAFAVGLLASGYLLTLFCLGTRIAPNKII